MPISMPMDLHCSTYMLFYEQYSDPATRYGLQRVDTRLGPNFRHHTPYAAIGIVVYSRSPVPGA